jgi:hypothetical protein
MDVLEVMVQNFSTKEREEAKELEGKIAKISEVILAEKQSIDSNFVRLSQCIDEVRSKKYWLLGNYKNFGEYVADCEKRFGIKHSQLYVGMKVARNLLPSVSEKDLVEIGITRAGALSKYVEQSGNSIIPDDILDAAKDRTKTSEEFDDVVNKKLHNKTGEIKDKWFNVGGFYASEDERQEILEALEVARSIDPVVTNTIPEWQQLKEALLRLAREFRSSYV